MAIISVSEENNGFRSDRKCDLDAADSDFVHEFAQNLEKCHFDRLQETTDSMHSSKWMLKTVFIHLFNYKTKRNF